MGNSVVPAGTDIFNISAAQAIQAAYDLVQVGNPAAYTALLELTPAVDPAECGLIYEVDTHCAKDASEPEISNVFVAVNAITGEAFTHWTPGEMGAGGVSMVPAAVKPIPKRPARPKRTAPPVYELQANGVRHTVSAKSLRLVAGRLRVAPAVLAQIPVTIASQGRDRWVFWRDGQSLALPVDARMRKAGLPLARIVRGLGGGDPL